MTKEPIHLYRVRFAAADEITVERDRWLHCKTTPFYIFAQAIEGHYELENPDGVTVCENGGAFFSAPGTPLRIRHFCDPATGRMLIRYLHFMLENAQGVDPFAMRELPLAVGAKVAAEPAALLARLIVSAREPFADNIALMQILAQLFQLTRPRPECDRKLAYVETLCDWIRHRAAEALTAEVVVAKAGYSRSKVFADFMAAVGMSPGDFILRERIALAARRLLEHPETGIQEVAAAGGWKNPYHFSRSFKAVTGQSPRAYRGHPFY